MKNSKSCRCICINDSQRPNEIPTSRWIKKGVEYHIIEVKQMVQQSNVLGCKLAEINNDDLFPYSYFSLKRFAINIDDLQQLGIEIVVDAAVEAVEKLIEA